MENEIIFQIICQILDKLHCSKANITLREFYLKGEEINFETKIDFNRQDSIIFFQEISNSEELLLGKHAFNEFQGKSTTIKKIVEKISQLTSDSLFINCCPNWPKKFGKISKEKKLSIENEFNELLDFAF